MRQIGESDLDAAINYSLLRGDMNSVIFKDGNPMDGTMKPEIIEREKERIIRSQLNSSDGNTVEIHDQVSRTN